MKLSFSELRAACYVSNCRRATIRQLGTKRESGNNLSAERDPFLDSIDIVLDTVSYASVCAQIVAVNQM